MLIEFMFDFVFPTGTKMKNSTLGKMSENKTVAKKKKSHRNSISAGKSYSCFIIIGSARAKKILIWEANAAAVAQ